jgi:hypothetical protein
LSVAIPFLWAGLHFYVAAPEDGRTPALSLIPLSSQYTLAAVNIIPSVTCSQSSLTGSPHVTQ